MFLNGLRRVGNFANPAAEASPKGIGWIFSKVRFTRLS